MNTERLSALAAFIAIGMSIATLAITLRFQTSIERHRWRRDLLPDLLLAFSDAFAPLQRVLADPKQWDTLAEDEGHRSALDAYAESYKLLNRLRLIGTPEMINAALKFAQAIDMQRAHALWTLTHEGEDAPGDRERYASETAEAFRGFLKAARRELGLEPLSEKVS